MIACAVQNGIVTLAEITLEEFQYALAYLDGQEQRRETPKPQAGCGYTPEQMLERVRDGQ